MKVGLVVLFSLMDLSAITLNAGVIAVILRTPHLLHNLTNSFVLNLCSAGLISALVIIPIWIFNFAAGAWVSPAYVCDIYGFAFAALSYTTIWTTCLISMERFYNIAYPMLHAVNLTLSRTLVLLASTWVLSSLLAALPLLYDQDCRSVYEIQGAICVNVFAPTVDDNEQWILIGILCFCVPTAIVALMYALIFNIARNAQRRIKPEVTSVKEKKLGLPSMKEAIFTSTGRLSIIGSPFNAYIVDEGLQNIRRQGRAKRSFSKEFLQIFKVGKTARTVIGVSGLFLGLWMPHFVLLFYGSLNTDMPAREQLECMATWLSFLTFIANPLLYGIGNRPIREELTSVIHRSPKVACQEDDNVPSGGDAEDFLQFLDRTGSAGSSESTPVRY